MMDTIPKNIPPKEKKVLVKVLKKAGYSSRTVEKWLGVSDTSVLRYSKAETPEELKQFESELKEILDQAKKKGIVLILKRMLEVIPGYARLDHLVKAAEYFEGIRQGGPNILVNVTPLTGNLKLG